MIPAAFRKALGLREGDELVLRLEDDAVRIVSLGRAVERAQAIVARYARGRRLSDELIAERRREAKRG